MAQRGPIQHTGCTKYIIILLTTRLQLNIKTNCTRICRKHLHATSNTHTHTKWSSHVLMPDKTFWHKGSLCRRGCSPRSSLVTVSLANLHEVIWISSVLIAGNCKCTCMYMNGPRKKQIRLRKSLNTAYVHFKLPLKSCQQEGLASDRVPDLYISWWIQSSVKQ